METAQSHRKRLIELGFSKGEARRLVRAIKPPTLDPSSMIQRIETHVGEGRAGHIGHYMLKASRKDYQFKQSDIMDIMQMFYVPDCDLFRCDKAMANLFSDYEPFAGKLVAKFSELPARINELL